MHIINNVYGGGVPECERVTCAPPPAPPHALLAAPPANSSVGATLRLECRPGWLLVGEPGRSHNF